jgi:hypothetical protein
MIGATESPGGTARPQVDVCVAQEDRPFGGASDLERYSATVIPMDSGDGRWWPHVRIADDSGNIVKDAGSTAVRFPTRAAAEHAGWSFVRVWISLEGR